MSNSFDCLSFLIRSTANATTTIALLFTNFFCPFFFFFFFPLRLLPTMAAATITQPRSSRRLFPTDSLDSTHQQLCLPSGCELVANTFVVFKWQKKCCVLQANLTLYCWGRRRSGAIEHVLDKYGLTHSPQLYRINGKEVGDDQWRWLKQIFLIVHRLFDDKELGDSLGKVRWINIVECSLAYDVMRRECYHYHQNLYPKGKVLTSYLKRSGIEVEQWYELPSLATDDPPPLSRPQTPPSNSSQESRGESPSVSSCGLGQREWLSDVHIANLMFLLLCRQLVLPLELRDLFQCVYPMTEQVFEQMLQRADPSSLLMHAKVGGGITLAFVNPNNNHWRLIVLDGLHKRVTLFDPLGAPLPCSLSRAIVDFVGSAYQVVDTQACLQGESWNCGVWAVYVALKYVTAVVQHVVGGSRNSPLCFRLREDGEDYSVLDADSTTAQRQQNRAFANEVRLQYGILLADAQTTGRLLYVSDEDGVQAREEKEDELAVLSPASNSGQTMVESMGTAPVVSTVIRAGIAAPVVRHRRFFERPLSELVWIDLTDGVGTVEVEEEEEMEQSYDDLCDQYIEFREDNINNSCAAALRYSLPAKLQSDILKEQINDFRAYRRQRFSLFRKGPLVEESTISSNISALLRFLGYILYQQSSVVQGELLDMGVFALPTINVLVLSYVEWLEQRRGKKRQALDSDSFQPVTCATVANYLNGLIGIVKFQLRHDLPKRDSLLDQLRNLRSQAESYSMTQRKFEKAHPEWCSWQELQVAREKCRAAFDERPVEGGGGDKDYLLHIRELCLLCLFTICPPPRCSIIRLLEWDKTLVLTANQQWTVDLTDLSHDATRHKTHKKKGAMLLPLPRSMYKYLSQLRSMGAGPVFPAGLLSKRSSSSTATSPFLSPTSFTTFVKATFRKYTDNGKGPNPSLLRSIFTTWLYGLRYDTDDAFLQEIKSSSAKWKAHSEQVASTVYNKELVYQQKEFAQLLLFCEAYSERYAYDRPVSVHRMEEKAGEVSARTRSSRKRRSREAEVESEHKGNGDEVEIEMKEYVVEALVRVRVSDDGDKQVLVKWDGYRRHTWEPYDSMREQLPEMMDELETPSEAGPLENEHEEVSLRTFLLEYIAEHSIDPSYRWRPDQVNALDHAAWSHQPRIKETTDQLRRDIMALVSSL
jgi:hypothetical protein